MRWKKQDAAPDSPSTQHAPATFVPPHQLSQVNDFTFSFTGQCHCCKSSAHRQGSHAFASGKGSRASTPPLLGYPGTCIPGLLVSKVSLTRGILC